MEISERRYPVDYKSHFIETRNRISAKDTKIIVEMYDGGSSLRDIAKHFSCSKNKIRSLLLRNRLKLRPQFSQATSVQLLKPSKQRALSYYGFCYFEGKIIKDPREFPILAIIHKHWSQNKTIHQIDLELNRVRIPSRTGKEWSWAAIRNIVTRFEKKQVILSKKGKYELR